MRRSLILTLMLLCAARSATAQTPESSPRRVRVWRMSAVEPESGMLFSLTRDSVVLRPDTSAAFLHIPLVQVAQIDEYRWARKGWKGFGIGLLAGLAVGGVAGWLSAGCDCDEDWRPYAAMVVGTLGAAVGGIGGAIIGHSQREERWVPLYLPRVRWLVGGNL